MSFRPRVAFLAAVLALVVCVAAGITLVRIDLERAYSAASLVRFDMSPLPRANRGLDGTRFGSRAPSLRFTPVRAGNIAGRPATMSVAPVTVASGQADAFPPAAAKAATSPSQAAGASASRAASQDVAPPMVFPAAIGEFAYRMESPFRDQLDAVMTQAQAQGRPARLAFPVADGRTVDLTITAHQPDAEHANQGVLYARVDDQPLAQVVLAYVDEAVAGSILTADGELFLVRYAGGGVHRTYQLDPNRIPDEASPLTPDPAGPVASPQQRAGQGARQQAEPRAEQHADLLGPVASEVAADQMTPPPIAAGDVTDMQVRDGSNTVVDVLILYTYQSRTNNGGTSGINALINAAVAKANLAFANSNARIWLRVVKTQETFYISQGNIGDDLAKLQNKADGIMDEAHTLRAQYNADLISLFTPSNPSGVVGIAYLLNPLTMGGGGYDWAVSVIVDWAADSNITFAHEVGHNFGAGHAAEAGCGVYSYACGYRFTALGQEYRTVMAYAPGLRIPYFSNPDLLYQGVQMGQAGANNALTIRQNSPGIAWITHGAADWTVSVQGALYGGYPHLLVRNIYSGVVDVWRISGDRIYSNTNIWPASNAGDYAWVPMVAAELNGDGRIDIVWRNVNTGRVIVWYMNGTTRVGTGVISAPDTPADAVWVPMAAGDFNDDGMADLIWRNQSTGRVIVWYMDCYQNGITRIGTATIWEPTNGADAAWIPMAAGDFNGDNKPDLIWRNLTTGRVIIWYMNGATRTGTFALWPATNPGDSSWRPMAVGQFNGDYQLDIVWRNTDTGKVIIWYMNATGTARIGTATIWS